MPGRGPGDGMEPPEKNNPVVCPMLVRTIVGTLKQKCWECSAQSQANASCNRIFYVIARHDARAVPTRSGGESGCVLLAELSFDCNANVFKKVTAGPVKIVYSLFLCMFIFLCHLHPIPLPCFFFALSAASLSTLSLSLSLSRSS